MFLGSLITLFFNNLSRLLILIIFSGLLLNRCLWLLNGLQFDHHTLLTIYFLHSCFSDASFFDFDYFIDKHCDAINYYNNTEKEGDNP